jgi:hypothetical protein
LTRRCVLDHADEIRATVKRAEKDFQLETTLKAYEEIWLSKTFQMAVHVSKQVSDVPNGRAPVSDASSRLSTRNQVARRRARRAG